MNYHEYLHSKQNEGVFLTHNAGDTNQFRYPHLPFLSVYFSYDSDRKYWRLNKMSAAENLSAALESAKEDITVYEFIAQAAGQIHKFDMTGVRYGDKDRECAFQQVLNLYEHKRTLFPEADLQTIRLSQLKVDPGFNYIAELYRDQENVPIHMLVLHNVPQFPFGSVLKGTDLVVTDGTEMNFGQDMVHALYHIKEGIPGAAGENLNVTEIWAPVPALYALQLSEGRLARRKRSGPSPHIIHFTDYIYLRAYLGRALLNGPNSETIHPAYSVIEPSIQPIMYALRNHSRYDINRIIADAILEDQTEELVSAFDNSFGKGSFAAVYGTYSLYEKYDLLTRYVSAAKAEEIFFETPQIMPSKYPSELIRNIWKNEERRYENIAVLSAGQ